jgi:hypothetical protein
LAQIRRPILAGIDHQPPGSGEGRLSDTDLARDPLYFLIDRSKHGPVFKYRSAKLLRFEDGIKKFGFGPAQILVAQTEAVDRLTLALGPKQIGRLELDPRPYLALPLPDVNQILDLPREQGLANLHLFSQTVGNLTRRGTRAKNQEHDDEEYCTLHEALPSEHRITAGRRLFMRIQTD